MCSQNLHQSATKLSNNDKLTFRIKFVDQNILMSLKNSYIVRFVFACTCRKIYSSTRVLQNKRYEYLPAVEKQFSSPRSHGSSQQRGSGSIMTLMLKSFKERWTTILHAWYAVQLPHYGANTRSRGCWCWMNTRETRRGFALDW